MIFLDCMKLTFPLYRAASHRVFLSLVFHLRGKQFMWRLEVQIFVLFLKGFHFSDPDHADSF